MHSHEQSSTRMNPEHQEHKHKKATKTGKPQKHTHPQTQHLHADGHNKKNQHSAHVDHRGHEQVFRKRFWVSLFLSVPVLLFSPSIQNWLGITLPPFVGSNLISPFFGMLIFFYGGFPFLKMTLPEIRNRKPGMMALISLAISVAFVYSLAAFFFGTGATFFWELVTLIDIMLLGHWLEMRSIRQASGALDELAKLMPDTAEKITPDGNTIPIAADDLETGDLVLVRPGAGIPADGIIVAGESEVSEAMITGESKPVPKTVQSKVIAGTLNGDGSLRIRVTATGADTALAGIMRLVEQAQQSKSGTQILADKAAGWLFYIALGTAALTGIIWSAAIGFNSEVIARVATVLVIACPHALGLAVPLVVAITTAKGARNGILVRDRLSLEAARHIDTVIFDKTGTLTRGVFGVVDILTAKGWDESRVLALASAVEGDSEHAIARGIRRSAKERGLSLPSVTSFQAIKGRGAKAQIGEHTISIGGPRLLEMMNITIDQHFLEFNRQANRNGQSVITLLQDRQVIACIAMADIIRPESKEAVDKLHQHGFHVVLLTGDSKATAQSVARTLGIKTVYAEILPEQKDRIVAELQAQGKRVAMVGDGVNDAPALTRADVGIAIGGGTDVAIESAGIILVRNNPLDVLKIFALSRASYQKMKENLIWATGYNIVAIPLAAGVLAPWGFLLSPAVGAVLMSLSTVIVALNAQLLRKVDLGQ